MKNDRDITKPFFVSLVLITFVVLVYFTIPLVEPEFTIQCVPDANCIISNITIHERLFGLA